MRDRWNENKDYNIDVGVVNQILWLRDRDYGILVWMKMSKTKNQTATKKVASAGQKTHWSEFRS